MLFSCSGEIAIQHYVYKSEAVVQTFESSPLPDAVMGKAEGQDRLWHGHVTAVTVAPEYRRQGLAAKFMQDLEDITENV